MEGIIVKLVTLIKKAAPRFELGIKDLQSSALPLGHAADDNPEESNNYINSIQSNYLLVICNGHGEDLIALEIIKRLLLLNNFDRIEVLPLVGNGYIFNNINSENFVKIGHQLVLPSGGFSNQSLRGLFLDLKAGMLGNLIKNWIIVRNKFKNKYRIIAIGDLLPLFFAWSSKCNFGFIGTPKSDHTWNIRTGLSCLDLYHKLKGSEWDPWEMYFMRSSLCQFIIVRDQITANNLNNHKIKAKFFGNPMMDFIVDEYKNDKRINSFQKIIILIGSRYPEAFKNLDVFLCCLKEINFIKESLIFVPLSANSDVSEIENYFVKHNFVKELNQKFDIGEESIWMKNNIIFLLGKNTFNIWANLADVGLANAGTATEQISGLGIPSLSIPGKGPQFTKSFARRQQRLLGGSVIVCKNKVTLIKKLINLLLNEKDRLKQGAIGMKRMGGKGGSQRIVDYINFKFQRCSKIN